MKHKQVVYIAGPMSGLPEENFPAFNRVADYLRSTLGAAVINPAESMAADPDVGDHAFYYRFDLAMILSSVDVIYLLPGWRDSKGAKLEVHVAMRTGIDVWEIIPYAPTAHEVWDFDPEKHGSTVAPIREIDVNITTF